MKKLSYLFVGIGLSCFSSVSFAITTSNQNLLVNEQKTNQDDVKAQFDLGKKYLNGKGVYQDYKNKLLNYP